MNGNNSQPGFGDNQGKVNPQSPNFMASAGNPDMSPVTGIPNSPPAGGSAVPPPLPPPSPPPAPSYPTMGAVPPPPPREMNIRTMNSDQDSLKASGGLGTQPKIVNPGGPLPPTPGQRGKNVDSANHGKGGKKKALLMGLGIVVFLGAAAAIANFFVLPIFLQDDAVVDLSEIEILDTEGDLDPIVTPTIPDFVHQTYFQKTTDATAEVNLSGVTLPNIDDGVTSVSSSNAVSENGGFTEFFVTQGLAASPVASGDLLGALLPDTQFATPLEDDFTGFLYSDGSSFWTGYVFAIDGGVTDKAGMKEVFNADFESSSSLTNLFLNDPGTPSADGFKDGTAIAGGGNARWISFSSEGASINYGWKGDFLVISTSFNGFKAAVANLGTATAPVKPVVEEAPDETAGEEATP